jgi:hypothetical protein
MIENIYIIHQYTGICLIHRKYGTLEFNQDLISGFLTALKDFAVKTSEGVIFPMDIGDFKIANIYKDGILITATLNKEDDLVELDRILKIILDKFIEKYSSEIEGWSGDVRIFREFEETVDNLTNMGDFELMMDSGIEPPFDAYEGKEPYLFVSYAHLDKKVVYPIIEELYKQGVRIWYDEGIPAASDWIAQIASTIINSACFLVFMTPRALKSENVRDEIHLAKDEKKKIFVIYLKDTDLPPDIRLQIGRKQALFWHKMSEERFWKKLKDELSEVINMPKLNNSITPQKSAPPQQFYASYSSKDHTEVLKRIQGIRSMPGVEVFLDCLSMRPGEKWELAIYDKILNSDLFLLFWSRSASESEWVTKEWKYALRKRGLDFIQPIPLEDPKIAPPPIELASKHFNDGIPFLLKGLRFDDEQ